MAIYRQLHTTFWKDKRVGEWSKDQKLFSYISYRMITQLNVVFMNSI
ncbi:hypothetical protein ACK4CS_16875 [Enterococcus gallinarum]|nr:hypothetical protein [Enterococcus gallinarum]MCI1135366.1 hypothetical protein [Enterococcus gallinarum]MCU7699600.1 hypothetical protein [Enterococcus gallinarum]MCW3745692.1 hypothetical protein [Enterococcus gallinarum]MDT2688206.1 hypothetical protein [Enterococcus gallinarum]